MNSGLISILLVILGIAGGTTTTLIINKIRVNSASAKVKELSDKARKESEKIKIDMIF